jgi:hypothetical protein
VAEEAARVPSFRGRTRELLRNSLRPFRILSKRCSLASASLRPNCPICGPAEWSGSIVEPSGILVPGGAERGLGISYHQPGGPLYNKERQRSVSPSHMRERKPLVRPTQASSGWLRPRLCP